MKNLNRRNFLKASAALGTGITFSAGLSGCSSSNALKSTSQDSDQFTNYWVNIPKEGELSFVCPRAEMGQGISTGLAILLCEALDYPITKLKVKNAPANRVYDHQQFKTQLTGGSSSTSSEYQHILNIGASIKHSLLLAASKKLKIDITELKTKDGFVLFENKRLSYQSLAYEISNEMIAYKDFNFPEEKALNYIGKHISRVDNESKILGTESYGIDTKNSKVTGIENPLVAVLIHPPKIGASPLSCNSDELLKLDGVKHVLKISTGFAIVATKYWQAIEAKSQFQGKWDNPKNLFDTKEYIQECKDKIKNFDGKDHFSEGDDYLKQEMEIEAEFVVPYLAHAPMEPQNCTININSENAQVWVPTQTVGSVKPIVSEITGLSEDNIQVNCSSLGGGFGRRGQADYIIQAAEIGNMIKKPVKLQFSREDDMKAGFYRPLVVTKMKASMDKTGEHIYLKQSIATQSLYDDILPDMMVGLTPSWVSNGVSRALGRLGSMIAGGTSVKEGANPPYNLKGIQINWNKMETPVPTLYWRSVGHSQNAFFVESFMDEIANKLKIDPIEFREKRLKKSPRLLNVLQRVKEISKWSDKNNQRHLGVATHFSFNSRCAAVIEVEKRNNQIKITNVWCVIDCGRAINPDGVHAQLMGSAIFGLTAALNGKIEYAKGEVVQSNFHDYQLMTMDQVPNIYTEVIDSQEPPTGVGEPAVPVMAPALCNALYSLTNIRYRELPLTDHLDIS